MKKNVKMLILGYVVSSLLVFVSLSNIALAAKKPVIGYATPGLRNIYWVTVKEEAENWAQKLGVELFFFGGDVVGQLDALNDMLARGVDAVVITPQDCEAIVPAIRKLNRAGIPVLAADIIPNRGDFIATVKSDAAIGGLAVGQFLLEKCGKNGKLFVLEPETYIDVIALRQNVAVDLLEENGWKIIRGPVIPYGRASAKNLTETILLANPDLDAIYTLNDDTALGSQLAVEALGRENVIVVGYDAIEEAVESVEQDKMGATVFQDSKMVVRWSIEQCLAYLRTPWPGTVVYSIPPKLITKDNVKEFKAEQMK